MKRLKNGTEKLENTVKQEKKLYQQLQEVLNSENIDMAPHQMERMGKLLQKKSQGGIDINYIRTVLFPEIYNGDIPQPMSNVAYARMTDRQEFMIKANNTSTGGGGIILFYPKVVSGYSILMQNSQEPNNTNCFPMSNANPALASVLAACQVGGYQEYSPYFSAASLVGASITVQYIGQIQQESGVFVGGQLYQGQHATSILSTQGIGMLDIENSQFRVVAKPSHGLRLVYMPKDEDDYVFYPVKLGMSRNDGINNVVADQFTLNPAICSDLTNVLIGTGNAQPYQYQGISPTMAIYWKGFANSVVNLRIEIVRRFNALVVPSQRDFIDMNRPPHVFDQKKTSDVVFKLTNQVPQLAGHSIKDMDRVSDQIQQYLPNIGQVQNLGEGLSGFSNALALGQAGLGANVGQIGQVWE